MQCIPGFLHSQNFLNASSGFGQISYGKADIVTIRQRMPEEKGVQHQMTQTVKRIWNWITTALVAFVVIIALLLVGVRLIGMQVFTVLSGSMEPTYHVGSLIYVKDVDPYTLTAGDVITFMMDEDTVATHRVVEVVPDENDATVVRFRTKGDANDAEDGSLVHYKNVIGSPVFSIPKLGYVANYIQNPPGTYIAISGAAVLMLLVFLPDLLFDEPKKEEPEEEKPQKTKKEKKAGGRYLR